MRSRRLLLAVLLVALPLAFLSAEPSTLHREKSFPAKPGGTVKVEASFHDVTVTVRPGATVDVTVDVKVSSWPGGQEDFVKSCEPKFSETGDTILISSKPSAHFSFGWQNVEAKIEVKMPTGMGLNASTGSGDCSLTGDLGAFPAAFHTGSGDIKVEGACRTFTTESGSGDVKVAFSRAVEKAEMSSGSGDNTVTGPVQELTMEAGSGNLTARLGAVAAKVSLHTGSGDQELRGGAKLLTASTGSGGITAEGLTGGAEMESGSGDIVARWAEAPKGDKISVESSSGEVRLTFPAGAALSGYLDSSSGTLRCDFPGTLRGKGEKRFDLAGPQGSSGLTVETSSGDITVIAAK